MILWVIFFIFASIFLVSFTKERRLFRNAIFFVISLLLLLMAITFSSHISVVGVLIALALFILLPLCIVLVSFVFIAAGITAIKKEGLSLSHSLSILFGLGIWGFFAAGFILIKGVHGAMPVTITLIFILMMAAYILFTFISLFIYSMLYMFLPKNKNCDFIIVHGAGLIGGDRVSKLLAGRLDKGIQVYELSGKKAKIIVSGGRGCDETMPEAQAMKNYLVGRGIPEESILMEDKSKTTLENMEFSKKLMDSLKKTYRCIFVTSDYHVFRAGTYARAVGLKAEGVGSKTAFYYWPNAFIREYIAVIIKYKLIPLSLTAFWILGIILTLRR